MGRMLYRAKPDDQKLHSGMLLVASPSLRDPNFEKAVVLLSAHEEKEGSLGVILNRPIQQQLGSCHESFKDGPLKEVPLYWGGPVQPNQVILAAWQWMDANQECRMFFGISQEKALELKEQHEQVEIRAFLGYSGWSDGQLLAEVDQNAWHYLIFDSQTVFQAKSPLSMWRELIRKFDPGFDGMLDYPEDPSLN
jgi:putative transcriptional regulator